MTEPSPSTPRKFVTTRWTRIRAAGGDTPESRRELAALCEAYRGPVHVFILWKWAGNDPGKAEVLTQGFFTRLLEKKDIRAATPDRGRFRDWLLTSARHYCIDEWRKEQAKKAGGGATHASIEADEMENCPHPELAHRETPERIFERRWAMTVLDRALSGMQAEYAAKGEAALFETLKLCLFGTETRSQKELAQLHGFDRVNTFTVRLSRFRDEFRSRVRREVAATMSAPDEPDPDGQHFSAAVDQEMTFLFQALQRGDAV
jgi:RNA polymerase sigma-70 factor (ECF subfamily)